ncbi:DNA-binding response regulator, OmpR family, contains REC and winged-helix (wHTH) domain [Rhodovulum sp. ES.010]|uniref:response regulator transcription factor n=1 Tax=Rhodovulum sp. ES.010 TaxID=1882821 RepID=UPI00092B745B|nr:response regulator transcription factor [Rhodovulum sp. ES.010]SIO29004.1 DNA-binding response regulator, OmpR family, contains REC and winged-helix (wHTH) domain [Rhodovulum sp. ES.010]
MAESETRILIVDDDPEITAALARGLALHGYSPICAHRVAEARDRFRAERLGAAIVDVMIGPDSGIDLVREVRAAGDRTPILMLSALSEVEDRTGGLDAGADDYIAKPFSFDELLARLKVQERRARRTESPRLRLEPATRTVHGPGRSVTLTEREYALFELLWTHPGEVLSRADLFARLWAREGTSSENVVDVYIGYLRRKLAPARNFGVEITTLRNRGFVLEPIADAPD